MPGDIEKGYEFTDGVTVTAERLNNLADEATIRANAVTVEKLQQIAQGKYFGRLTASTGDPEVLDIPVTAGMVAYFAANSAPTGWLKANGAAVSRTTYAALFAVIGTTFGAGDGVSTFTLPDLRGEFVRGWDDSRGVDSGRSFGSAQAQAIPNHSHGTANAVSGGPTPINDGSTATIISGEVRPRNVALLGCIKF